MNYIISSIVLLAVIMIIIYILSIDNNADKFKNKIKEVFTVVKSKKINYLNDKDNKNLLLYIKQHFKSDDNIIIPTKIYYEKTERGYEMNDIHIICYKYNNKQFNELPYNINILFVPFEKDNYISDQTLFGYHGHYLLTILDNNKSTNDKPINDKPTNDKPINDKPKNVNFNDDLFIKQKINSSNTSIPQTEQPNSNPETYTDVLEMIPDIIHLTESDDITTDTEKLISHNFK
jgi:hypothetical protein